jgi:hypothetical protein
VPQHLLDIVRLERAILRRVKGEDDGHDLAGMQRRGPPAAVLLAGG